jgi:hypothetical protein
MIRAGLNGEAMVAQVQLPKYCALESLCCELSSTDGQRYHRYQQPQENIRQRVRYDIESKTVRFIIVHGQ